MTLVIGFGNPLRGDDAAGLSVAMAAGLAHADLAVLTPHQLVPELAAEVAAADVVIFVDASINVPPGDVRCQSIVDASDGRLDHVLSPAALVGLARAAFGRAPRAWLVEVGAGSFELGAPLSPLVAGAIPRAVALLHRLVPPTHLSRPA